MSNPLVQTCFARTIPHVLPTLGLGSVSILETLPVQLRIPKHKQSAMPLRQLVHILNTIADHTRRPDFGLLFGTTVSLRALGPFGMRLAYAQNIDDALNFLSRFIGRIQQATEFEVTSHRHTRLCKLRYTTQDLGNTDHLLDAQLALLLSALVRHHQPCWRPKRVYLRRKPPAKLGHLVAAFGSDVAFGQEFDGFSIGVGPSQPTAADHDPNLCRIFEEVIVLRTQDWPEWGSLIDTVRRKLINQIDHGGPSIERIATETGMSVRTLQRRLKSEGVSFSDLVDQVRMDIAKQRLHDKR